MDVTKRPLSPKDNKQSLSIEERHLRKEKYYEEAFWKLDSGLGYGFLAGDSCGSSLEMILRVKKTVQQWKW